MGEGFHLHLIKMLACTESQRQINQSAQVASFRAVKQLKCETPCQSSSVLFYRSELMGLQSDTDDNFRPEDEAPNIQNTPWHLLRGPTILLKLKMKINRSQKSTKSKAKNKSH